MVESRAKAAKAHRNGKSVCGSHPIQFHVFANLWASIRPKWSRNKNQRIIDMKCSLKWKQKHRFTRKEDRRRESDRAVLWKREKEKTAKWNIKHKETSSNDKKAKWTEWEEKNQVREHSKAHRKSKWNYSRIYL